MSERPLSPWWGALAEPLYRLGSAVYHGSYESGLRRVSSLPVPVISIGNLAVGGTGKTPAVLSLVKSLLAEGRTPVVLTRGYRAGDSGVLRNGRWNGGDATAAEAGDEPLLLSRELPDVAVVIGKRRVEGARTYLGSGQPADVFVLDDGFQHRSLKRDLDLVLLDHARPLGNYRMLPAGPLREPPASLSRAHRLIFTGGLEGTPPTEDALNIAARFAPRAPWGRAWMTFDRLAPLSETTGPSPGLAGLQATLVAGIARPERFHEFLEREGVSIRESRWFPDHHRFSPAEVAYLESTADTGVLLTTAKDAVRLAPLVSPTAPWWVVHSRLVLEGGWNPVVSGLLA